MQRGGQAADARGVDGLGRGAVGERGEAVQLAPVGVQGVSAGAALGGEIEVPGIDREPVKIKIPSGIQSGKQLRLRGKGMPALRGAVAGDLYIELAVETPVNLSVRQRELLGEFEAEGKNNSPETQDFFSRLKGFWEGMKG